jgi:hypothetical protein
LTKKIIRKITRRVIKTLYFLGNNLLIVLFVNLGFGIWDLGFGIWDLGFGRVKNLQMQKM